ncbi:major facilitator superfamily MFS_1 [Burkholderia sp. lig30]|jgi:MFS family permease|uniref:MFS transporter n=1 Tax=Burkholderia sp. lig30 TaxID=1192124 RepID=UPI000461D453|nr:MFS transporter [Burkholderia sp. lig30]KDB08154.1 major facilitator superfamily MFS_1 [Burkholderia sp. lig30]
MHRKHAALLCTVCLLCALEFLETGMLAFASVPIRNEISASPEEYSFIASLYACVAVVAISVQRWLVERVGWRSYIVGSIAIYVAGALICGTSSQMESFALGRVVMAMGGASFLTSSRVMVNMIPPGPGRFVGVKVFAVGLASGTAAAPLISSLAVTYDTWQSIFWALVAISILAGALAITFLPATRVPEEGRTRTTAGRVLLLSMSSFALLYSLQRSYYEFYTSTFVLVAFALLAALSVYIYFSIELSDERPLLKIRELLAPRYSYGVLLFCFCYLLVGANNYILPSFMQTGLGFSWQTIGRYQSLALLASLVTWLVMSRIVPKYPAPKKFLVLGFLALATVGWQLSSLTPNADMRTHVLPALALNGCFTMLVLATTAMQTFQDVGSDEVLFSHAQQVKNMAAQVASAMGVALATVFSQWRSTVHYSQLNMRLQDADPVFTQALQHLSRFLAFTHEPATSSKIAMAYYAQETARQSNLMAYVEYFWLISWIGVLAIIVSSAQRVFR